MAGVRAVQQHNTFLQAQMDAMQSQKYSQGRSWATAHKVAGFQSYSQELLNTTLPKQFASLQLDRYSSATDPRQHSEQFNIQMVVMHATDAQKCLLFTKTLKDDAMTWFTKQPPGSIHNFLDLSTRFLAQFCARRVKDITTTELYNVRQGPQESLREYLLRYDSLSMALQDEEPAACSAAFKNGLRQGPLNSKFVQENAKEHG